MIRAALNFVKERPMATGKAIVLTLIGTGAVLEALAAVRELVPKNQPKEFKITVVKRGDALESTIELKEGDVPLFTVGVGAYSDLEALDLVRGKTAVLFSAAKPC